MQTRPRVRRSIFDLSETLRMRYFEAELRLNEEGHTRHCVDIHYRAMMSPTLMSGETTSTTGRNAAHRGPVVWPWHRAFVSWHEDQVLRYAPGLEGMPYLPTGGDPLRILGSGYLGHSMFREWRTYTHDGSSAVQRPTRGFVHAPGTTLSHPPSTSEYERMFGIRDYDRSPWNEDNSLNSTSARRALERPHDNWHVYYEGDLRRAWSPSHLLFFLIHTCCDRFFAEWQRRNGYTKYAPGSGTGPSGHRLNDTMRFLPVQATPASMLDHRSRYSYASPR